MYIAFNLADIITVSIGEASGWTESSLSVVVSRIIETGVICTIATGNHGRDGKRI